eukprot:GHVS01045351.1.p1 GENE.GHVS01045351.1~~GHVS01045351.1.p1  ORF type:complete len:316 (+),score=53.52 GHVS01045351.1:459-1406(+)
MTTSSSPLISDNTVIITTRAALWPLAVVMLFWITHWSFDCAVPATSFWLLLLSVAVLFGFCVINTNRMWLLLFVYAAWAVSLCIHEFARAVVALVGGDITVTSKGYLSMDPMHYADLLHSLVSPIALLLTGGFALPGGAVWINAGLLRSRLWLSAVAAAGPVADLVCAIMSSLFFHVLASYYLPSYPRRVLGCVTLVAALQVESLLLNSLPLPGLDGWAFVLPWLPHTPLVAATQLWQFGGSSLFFLFYFAVVEPRFPMFSRITEGVLVKGLRLPVDLVRQAWLPSLLGGGGLWGTCIEEQSDEEDDADSCYHYM